MTPRRFYEDQAKEILKQLREDKDLTYAQLAQRLQAHGARMETRALINKINRGRFTFAFALQVLAALEVGSLKIPNVIAAQRAAAARRRAATRAVSDMEDPREE